jgi:hypothetical protein
MVTWQRVAELARQLPEIEETLSWQAVVQGAREAVRGPELTPRFEASPAFLLIWLEHIDEDEVRERLIDGWLIQAPKRLAAQHQFD